MQWETKGQDKSMKECQESKMFFFPFQHSNKSLQMQISKGQHSWKEIQL